MNRRIPYIVSATLHVGALATAAGLSVAGPDSGSGSGPLPLTSSPPVTGPTPAPEVPEDPVQVSDAPAVELTQLELTAEEAMAAAQQLAPPPPSQPAPAAPPPPPPQGVRLNYAVNAPSTVADRGPAVAGTRAVVGGDGRPRDRSLQQGTEASADGLRAPTPAYVGLRAADIVSAVRSGDAVLLVDLPDGTGFAIRGDRVEAARVDRMADTVSERAIAPAPGTPLSSALLGLAAEVLAGSEGLSPQRVHASAVALHWTPEVDARVLRAQHAAAAAAGLHLDRVAKTYGTLEFGRGRFVGYRIDRLMLADGPVVRVGPAAATAPRGDRPAARP